METYEQQFEEMSEKLLAQELRIKEKALEDLRNDYDKLRVREQSLMEKTRWEQGRTKAQEDKVHALTQEVNKIKEDMDAVIRERDNLKNDLKNLRRKSADNTARLQFESEIINYRAKVAGLESRLSRRQTEFDKSEEYQRTEIQRLQALLEEAQLRADTEEKENFDSASVEKLNELHYKIGDLTATNKGLHDDINRHTCDKAELQEEVKNLREEIESLKGTNNVLHERLADTEGSSENASKYYTEELSKIKSQKAEIRCELFRLKREHEKLLKEQQSDDGSKEKHESEIAEWKKKVAELESKLVEVQRRADENESSERGQIQQLTDDLKKATAAIALQQEALQTLDGQCEDLVKRLQLENASKKAAKAKVISLETEIKDLKRDMENKKMLEEDIAVLKAGNDRLLDKIGYLEKELRESHTDHREELVKLARQVSTASPSPTQTHRQTEDLAKKCSALEATLRQNENVVRSLQRQCEQSRNEVDAAEKALSDLHEKHSTVLSENSDLLRALNEAVGKLQKYKNDEEKFRKEINENHNLICTLSQKIDGLQDEIATLRQELIQKDANIAYLQSLQQPRKLDKLKYSNSRSTLVTGADENEVKELEATRDALQREYSFKSKELAKRKEGSTSSFKSCTISNTTGMDQHHNSTIASSRSQMATMRHDIPHRWSKDFMQFISPKCEICFEHVARFSHAFRCKLCGLVAHPHCKPLVQNNCGMPFAFENYFRENRSMIMHQMSGWVKFCQASEESVKKWNNAFAIIEENCLAFYESDLNYRKAEIPLITLDLSQEHCRIFSHPGAIAGMESFNADALIEIKMKEESLYVVTETAEAKRNWIHALQGAADRRILD